MWSTLLVLFICQSFHVSISQNYGQNNNNNGPPIVTTPLGQIKGSILKSRLGRDIYSYRGVRYAKAPVGELRFKPPVPYKWEGIYDATGEGPWCPQVYFNNTSEDCLVVNVYTTKLPQGRHNPKRPVIVFIHDGAFIWFSGASSLRGPQYFMDQDIVLVTLNYRLGTLGMISTGEEDAPGNNGLKDMVVALKWVQRNIEAFGGDKDSVTLLGYSAGGWSITMFLTSPMTRGLFHKAIAMSGSALGVWPLRNNQLEIARKQASLLGCPSDTSRNIINCLKTKSADEIVNTVQNAHTNFNPTLIWSPVIEKDFGQERFLTTQPIKDIVEGNFQKIPIIFGINKDEMAYKAYQLLSNETERNMLNSDFEKYYPYILDYERNTERSKQISRSLRKFYMNDRPLNNETVRRFGKMCADVIGFAVNRAVKLIAQHSNKSLHYYQVTYLGRVSDFYLPGSNDTIPYGVAHQDELIYLFYAEPWRPLFDDKNWPDEARSVRRLTTLWANFARTGNPTPTTDELFNNTKWREFNLESQKYLDIGRNVEMKNRMFEERYAVWERLFPISQYLRETR